MEMEDIKTIALWLVVIGACAFGVHKCTSSEWYQESEREDARHKAFLSKPHIINQSDDGCFIYEWLDNGGTGTAHHFTRCPNSTTTDERNYTENCGKNCVKHKQEITVTESH